MSLLSYNGVNLQLNKSNTVERIVNLSDDKTEYKWTDFIIDVTCIYNPAATSYTNDGPSTGQLPMVTDTAVRSALLQPRRALLFQEGGIDILNIPGDDLGYAIDCDNGPTPQSCNIIRIGSSRIFWVNYVIKCSIIECPVGGIISPIASNRYSRTESIDQDFISTLTTSGVCYFRSNVLTLLGNNADFYRSQIIPQPLLGYKRNNVNFSLDSNGTICRWMTIDVEQKIPLGSQFVKGTAASVGITQMGLVYHVGSLTGGPAGTASSGSVASVTVWAQGARYMDTFACLQFIVAIAWQKLFKVALIGMLASGGITEDVFNNRVEVQLSFVILDDTSGLPNLYMPIKNIVGSNAPLIGINGSPNPAFSDGSNPMPPFSKGTRGTAAYMLAVKSFALACAQYVPFDPTGQVTDPSYYNPGSQSGIGPIVLGYFDPGTPQPPNPQAPVRKQVGQRSLYGQSQPEGSNTKETIKEQKGTVTVPVATNASGTPTPTPAPTPTPTPSPSPTGTNPSPGVSCVVLQLFRPITVKEVEFSYTNIGATPILPDTVVPQNYANNYTLIKSDVSTGALDTMADGFNLVYRVSGKYTYSLSYPLNLGSQMNPSTYVEYCIPPYIGIQPSAYTRILSSDFQSGIINT